MATKNDPYAGLEEPSDEPMPKEDKPGDDEEGETVLIPKSFFGDQELKSGQQYYVEVVREYEDEVEVKYPKQVKEEKEKPTAKADMAMDAMMGENPGNPGNPY